VGETRNVLSLVLYEYLREIVLFGPRNAVVRAVKYETFVACMPFIRLWLLSADLTRIR
jgi:hypothetical protein